MSLDAPSPQDSQQLLLYKIAVATVTTSANAPTADQRAALDAADAPSAENPFITASGLPAATTTTAGVVLLAEGPDETTNPGSTKILTAGDFNTAGVELLDSVGGMLFANEFYANSIRGQSPGFSINRSVYDWRMQIGTDTPADTVADAYGVGTSNGAWRVGQNMGGESLRLTDGTFSTILRTTPWYGDAMSFGFEFLEGAAQTGSLSVGMGGYVNLTGSSGASLTTPGGGQVFCSMEGVMIDGIGLGFFGASRVAKQTGTPANATDLASAIALVNNLKAKLIAYGLIA